MSKTQKIVEALNISLANGEDVAKALNVGFYGLCDHAGNLASIPEGKLAYVELWAINSGKWTRKIASITRGFDGIYRSA